MCALEHFILAFGPCDPKKIDTILGQKKKKI